MRSVTPGLILFRSGRTIVGMIRPTLHLSVPILGALVLVAAPAAAQRGALIPRAMAQTP